MGKVLVVLTDKYPYGTGETFIENERAFWDVFDHVYLCPVILSDKDILREGFVVKPQETLITTTSAQYRKKDLLRSAFLVAWAGKTVREIRQIGLGNRRKVKTVLSYAARSDQRASLIGGELAKHLTADDKVAIYSYWFLEPALVGVELADQFSSRMMFTRAHGYDIYEERHANSFLPFRKLLLETYKRICPISKDGENYIISHYGKDYAEKTSIERLGTIRYYPVLQEPECDEGILLVSCSAITSVKRVHLIVEALKKSTKKIHWVHFGDGDLRKSIELQIKELPSHVTATLMGFMQNKEIQEYYSEHTITAFINVSESEGVPVSIMEAQSYGIPVLATDVGGTSELVHDYENGILLKKDFCSEDLLNALAIITENYDHYREDALQTWEKMSNANRIYKDFFSTALQELQ